MTTTTTAAATTMPTTTTTTAAPSTNTTTTTPAPQQEIAVCQISFVSTLPFTLDEFSEALQTRYKKAVIFTLNTTLDPETDYQRVTLNVTDVNMTRRRRLLQSTIRVFTTVDLDTQAQLETAAAAVKQETLNASCVTYEIRLLYLSAVETRLEYKKPLATPQPPPPAINILILALSAGGGVLFVALCICLCVCIECLPRKKRKLQQTLPVSSPPTEHKQK